MSSEEAQSEFDHAVALLGVEAEYILNDRLDQGDYYVSDDEPYPGFEGPWVYVDDGKARLLCRWMTVGDGDDFADEDSPDGDFGDVTLDSLDLDKSARWGIDMWAAEAAILAGYRVGEPSRAQAAHAAFVIIRETMRAIAARTRGVEYRARVNDLGVVEHELVVDGGGGLPCAWVRTWPLHAQGAGVEARFSLGEGSDYVDLSFTPAPAPHHGRVCAATEESLDSLFRLVDRAIAGGGQVRELPM